MAIINCSKLRVWVCISWTCGRTCGIVCACTYECACSHEWMAEIEIMCDPQFSTVFPEAVTVTHSTRQVSDFDPRVTMDSIVHAFSNTVREGGKSDCLHYT